MKVLHVINSYSGIGGAEVALARLINGLPQFEHRLLALLSVSEGNRKLLDDPSVLLAPVGMQSVTDTLRTVKAVRQSISDHEPDLVVGWMYLANAICALAIKKGQGRVPLIWTMHHALDNLRRESFATRSAIRVCRLLRHRADHIVYVGRRVRRQHEQQGFSHPRTSVIPHGVSKVLGSDREKVFSNQVGILARWHDSKDWATMIEAMRIVQEQSEKVHFLLGGLGITADNAELMTLLRSRQIDERRITLLGLVQDTATFYRSVDILLLGSRTEAGPIVLMEAMGSRVAPVTTDVGDAQWIAGNADLVTPVGDARAIAEKVSWLLADPDAYCRIAAESRQRIEEHFSAVTQLGQYRRLFNEVASG